MSNAFHPHVVSLGVNRRRFIYTTSASTLGLLIAGCATARVRYKSPNEKLNVAAVGAGGKGGSDIAGLYDNGANNVVALCDVDSNTLDAAAKKYPGAKRYRDYRKMLAECREIDAINVSTPDHQHYPAAMIAMSLGKHVYVQKPLTHTVWEARQLMLAARRYKVATQMGNQGHSGIGNRELCEIIWAGTIGEVREVHCWTNRPIWPQGIDRPKGSDPVPANLDWDLWLGPAPYRPFVSPRDETDKDRKKKAGRGPYHPFNWRGWWDFGCGALGDMGCHVMDGPVWAMRLGNPLSVETVESSPVNNETAPAWSVLKYQFPARDKMPPLTLYWHDGSKQPERPREMESPKWGQSGSLFIGSKGKLWAGEYGGDPKLLPESKMKDFVKPPATIPRVPENSPYKDFIRACKGGLPACSNFDVAGPFTEIVLLGNLALRAGKRIEWDGPSMRAWNAPEVAKFVNKDYRAGWRF